MNSPIVKKRNLMTTLVHLGKKPDDHFWLNLNKISRDFPSIEVSAVVSKGVERDAILSSEISVYEYSPSSDVEKIFELHNYDHNFRGGFWRYTLERLFAITQLHETLPDKKILHVESDVLLLPNFPFSKIEKLNELSWCRFNEAKDVSSVLYIPDLDSSLSLREKLLNELKMDNTLTDMTILNRISRNNPSVHIFPSMNRELPKLQNRLNLMCDSREFEICSNDEFNGIFDPAAIGMWLTGLDPRNYYGITKIHDRGIIDTGDSYVDASQYTYKFDSQSLLSITGDGISKELFCLHIHSKNLKLFRDGWENELRKLVELSGDKEPISKFKFAIFANLILLNIRQKTLLSLVIGIPIMQKLRRNIIRYRRDIQ